MGTKSRSNFAIAAALLLCKALGLGELPRAYGGERLAPAAEFVGFDLFGNHNPLSGGIDFLATNEFEASSPFDFGAWNVALDGPLSLEVSTGGRLLSQFDVHLTTGVNGDAAAIPLTYAYTLDTGPQVIQVNGSVLADVDFALNRLGYYDLQVFASGRQTSAIDGEVTGTKDFDTGPITISGNIFADALAVLTDPLFDRAGQPNLFVRLSGNDTLEALLAGTTSDRIASADSDSKRIAEIAYKVIVPPGIENGNGNGPPGGFNPGNGQGGPAVPEPAVLALMLVGAPVLFLRQWRGR
jgi:hypothetical protein